MGEYKKEEQEKVLQEERGHLKVGGRLLKMFHQFLLQVLECVLPVNTHSDGYTMQ